MPQSLETQLAAYIATRLPDARDVVVSGLARISGGASRETYRFRLGYRGGDGQAVEERLILRRDPPSSLIDTQRRVEFAAYAAFHGSAVPVPKMLWLEEDASHLGHPFFVAEEIAGFEAGPMLLQTEPYLACLPTLAERKWTILGEISRADPDTLDLMGAFERIAPDACWKRELDYWEGVIDEDEQAPQPIIRAAIRWLRANPPPPAQKVGMVHGDYRTGNFLYDTEGGIHGILDWEMAHLGDPLEDLGWSLNRIWCWAKDDRRGGLVSRETAIAIWERASGLKADPAALHWWELFNCVKGQGIWISSAKAWIDGANRDPILAYSAWLMLNAQDRAALELMGRL
ncbi:MAG TPA: phosphotransferase family protein [Caulobacteraceae bacterium]|jgi:aminoglycoside phosphotransferase (APT) family kinase protein